MNKYGKRFQGEEDIGFPIMEETPTIGTGPVSDSEIYEMLMRIQERNKREQNALNRSPSGMGETRDMNSMMPSPSPYESASPSPSPDISGYDSAVISTATPYPVTPPERVKQIQGMMKSLGYKDWKPDPREGRYPEPIGPRPSPELEKRLQKEKFDKDIAEINRMFDEQRGDKLPKESRNNQGFTEERKDSFVPAFSFSTPTPTPSPSPSATPSYLLPYGTGLFEDPEYIKSLPKVQLNPTRDPSSIISNKDDESGEIEELKKSGISQDFVTEGKNYLDSDIYDYSAKMRPTDPSKMEIPESISEYDKKSPYYNPAKAKRFKKTKAKVQSKSKVSPKVKKK